MSLFMQFPWIATSNVNDPQQQQQQQQSSFRSGGNTSQNSSTAILLATLGVDADRDTELVARLAEAAASGKVLNQDLVVDCQLTQFPPYGTVKPSNSNSSGGGGGGGVSSATASSARETDGDEDDPDNDDDDAGEDNERVGRTRSSNSNANANAAEKSGGTGTSDHWLGSWMNLGGSTAANAVSKVTKSRALRQGGGVDSQSTTEQDSAGLRQRGGSNLATIAWDAEEQRLWKLVPPHITGSSQQQQHQNSAAAHHLPGPLQATSRRGKPFLLYRTPLVSRPRHECWKDPVEEHGADGEATTTNVPSKKDSTLDVAGVDLSLEQVVETTLADLKGTAPHLQEQQQQQQEPQHPHLSPQSPQFRTTVMGVSPSPAISGTTTPAAPTATTSTSTTAATNNNNNSVLLTLSDRQHWMPDQLCKQCYACETPFTVFRRRHHCRLCG